MKMKDRDLKRLTFLQRYWLEDKLTFGLTIVIIAILAALSVYKNNVSAIIPCSVVILSIGVGLPYIRYTIDLGLERGAYASLDKYRDQPPSYRKRIILSGPAGSGKDYLKDAFEEVGFIQDISYTSRPARVGEVQGVAYHFIADKKFDDMKFLGEFYEHVEFNNAQYGTSQKSWEESEVFIMTPSGVAMISEEEREDCYVVYLNIEESLRRKRISKRSDGGFDKFERRIAADNKDFLGFEEKCDMMISNPYFNPNETIKRIVDASY